LVPASGMVQPGTLTPAREFAEEPVGVGGVEEMGPFRVDEGKMVVEVLVKKTASAEAILGEGDAAEGGVSGPTS